jgi:hypothetical protein
MQLIEETKRQINRLFEEVARLSDSDMSPTDYYGEVLKRILTALVAHAGAVWVKTQQGNLQLQYQIKLNQVGLDKNEESRKSHDELLRQAFIQGRPLQLPPHASAGKQEGSDAAAGNPTDFIILLAPILIDKQVVGLIEVWQHANRHPDAVHGFLQFLVRMADLASLYTRNHMLRQMGGQQQLWTQLEAFSRQIHGSLNPIEVSYVIANEGRRLIQCDRVSVAARFGRKVSVEAVSGADVVEKRSNLIQLMRKLFDSVLKWGEKLVYNGTKDDSLPPAVSKALDSFLAESNSKLLVVMPLRDEREAESKRPPRSALMMECFEPSTAPEQLIARMEVVGKHTTTAVYNAVEHRRIPMRFLWMPLAKLQEGLGGKAKAITFGILAAVAVLVAVLCIVPYPLKMDATGQLLPETRRWVFSPTPAQIVRIDVDPGETIPGQKDLLLVYDQKLQLDLITLKTDIDGTSRNLENLKKQLSSANLQKNDKIGIESEINKQSATLEAKSQQLNELLRRTNAEDDRAGYYHLKAPAFPANIAGGDKPANWTVLNADFKEQLLNREVKPSDPLLRLGHKEGPWEIELKIPQKHIGQVLAAFGRLPKDAPQELDVDILVRTDPTRTFKGKLHRDKVAGEAKPNQTDQNEPEPIVLAYVRIEGDDIPAKDRLPRDLLVAGAEVHAKVRCGSHKMGYSLFYGVWEFIYEKVVFFF